MCQDGTPGTHVIELGVEVSRNEIVHCILWIRRSVVLSAQFFVFFHLFHFFLFKNVINNLLQNVTRYVIPESCGNIVYSKQVTH